MKENFEKLPFAMLIGSLVTAFISSTARCALTVTTLDARYGVYESSSILPTLYHAFLIAALIALAVIAFLKAPSREEDYVRAHSDLTVFASFVCAFMLIANAGASIYYIVRNLSLPSTFDILELCFSPLAIVYFIGLARSQRKQRAPLALMSMFVIALCAVCLIRVYFDNSALQVSPNKIMNELAFLSAMIYFLSEARAQLGILKHRLYLASALTAPVLLLSSAVPNLLFPRELSIGESDNFMHYAVCVALAIFIWARLYAYAKYKDTNE